MYFGCILSYFSSNLSQLILHPNMDISKTSSDHLILDYSQTEHIESFSLISAFFFPVFTCQCRETKPQTEYCVLEIALLLHMLAVGYLETIWRLI